VAQPASYTMGTGSFSGVKRSGHGVDHPAPSSAEVIERVELYLDSTSEPSWPVLRRTLPLPLPLAVYRKTVSCANVSSVYPKFNVVGVPWGTGCSNVW